MQQNSIMIAKYYKSEDIARLLSVWGLKTNYAFKFLSAYVYSLTWRWTSFRGREGWAFTGQSHFVRMIGLHTKKWLVQNLRVLLDNTVSFQLSYSLRFLSIVVSVDTAIPVGTRSTRLRVQRRGRIWKCIRVIVCIMYVIAHPSSDRIDPHKAL